MLGDSSLDLMSVYYLDTQSLRNNDYIDNIIFLRDYSYEISAHSNLIEHIHTVTFLVVYTYIINYKI